VETPGFDLIAMGRPEGPGCYCYANNLLRDVLGSLSFNYHYVVIDNQAGMEHLSRQMARNIDYLLVISDPSARGIRAAGKISRLIKELDTRLGEKYLILNRVQNSIDHSLKSAIEEEGLKLFHSIPEDDRLLKWDQEGKPIYQIALDSPAYQAAGQLLTKLLSLEKNKD
jgi:CO dehydrogenase maturation factor